MLLDCVVVGPIQCNCYILAEPTSRKAYLIDPGAETPEFVTYLQNKKWDLEAILITHCHIDHVGGLTAVLRDQQPPVYFHPGDQFLFDDVTMQARLFGVTPQQLQASQPASQQGLLSDGQRFSLDGETIAAIHTPGHTPGSVCYLAMKEGLLFTGDTLFQGSIGRTDLWGGSFAEIIKSIREKLLVLGDEVRVFPGHGPETTIREERASNPFLR
jgi:hydroxyacylglutathione hydrolase